MIPKNGKVFVTGPHGGERVGRRDTLLNVQKCDAVRALSAAVLALDREGYAVVHSYCDCWPDEFYRSRNIRVLTGSSYVVVLPGWEDDEDAYAEVAVARMLDIPVYDFNSREIIKCYLDAQIVADTQEPAYDPSLALLAVINGPRFYTNPEGDVYDLDCGEVAHSGANSLPLPQSCIVPGSPDKTRVFVTSDMSQAGMSRIASDSVTEYVVSDSYHSRHSAPNYDPKSVSFNPLGDVGPDAPIVTNASGGKQSACAGRFDLMPPFALARIAAVLQHGAQKYDPWNWRKIDPSDHLNHALAHANAFIAGDTSEGDPIEHLAHFATRAMFALDTYLIQQMGDAK